MDPNLSLPTAIWSASLKLGYVGCLKDLVINGADIDVVAYTHEQNSGEKMHKIDINGWIKINWFSYFIYSLGFA